MVQDKPLRTSWQRKMKDRQERKLAKDFARHLEEEKERRRQVRGGPGGGLSGCWPLQATGETSCPLTQRPWEDRELGQKQKRSPGPQGREAQWNITFSQEAYVSPRDGRRPRMKTPGSSLVIRAFSEMGSGVPALDLL